MSNITFARMLLASQMANYRQTMLTVPTVVKPPKLLMLVEKQSRRDAPDCSVQFGAELNPGGANYLTPPTLFTALPMLHNLKPCERQTGGFCFENSRRNAVLESTLSEVGYKAPSARKTGTTIAGIIYKGGVILGADTRATDDMVVADKNCMKIHYIAPKIYCCGAGVAADAEITTQIMSSNVELHMLNTGRPPLVAMVTRQLKQMLFRYQGHVGSSLIVGGVDVTGAHLYSVYPHGSYDKLPFVSMGSGAAAAVSVFEDRFKPNMELEEAKLLVRDAIAAGIFCDLGSGSNVDLCVITEAGVKYLRGYDKPTTKGKREGQYRYKPGTTAVLTKTVTPLSLDVVEESVQTMDTE